MIEVSALRIKFDLVGQGWASCTTHADAICATITASYLSDALGDLARAVLVLKKSGRAPDAVFAEEPGQYRWTMGFYEQAGDKRSHVRLGVYFDKEWIGVRRPRTGDRGKPVLDVLVPSRIFFRAVVDMLEDVLDRYGAQGYEELWNGESVTMHFPSVELSELKETGSQSN